MSTTLALLAAEYREAAMQLADMDLDAQTVADTLEAMSGDLEVKATNVALFVRCLEADAAAVKQWAKDATDRAKAIENRAASLRKYLSDNMEAAGLQKIEGPGVRISWRKSSAVMIDDAAQIPAAYMRTPEAPPPEPNKAAIKAAIQGGAEIPGARIEDRRGLVIA